MEAKISYLIEFLIVLVIVIVVVAVYLKEIDIALFLAFVAISVFFCLAAFFFVMTGFTFIEMKKKKRTKQFVDYYRTFFVGVFTGVVIIGYDLFKPLDIVKGLIFLVIIIFVFWVGLIIYNDIDEK